MKTATAIVLGLAAVAAIGFAVYMVDIDQTQEAALPDVDVSVEGGQMPEFEAETGSISVDSETAEVTVPDVDVSVDTETAEVSVPDIDITPAGEADEDES